jgi:putative nucleotidyltransferase with HDIG domain
MSENIKHIVIIDDEKYICNIIIEALAEFKDYRAVMFNEPQKALDYIAENNIDLVLSDLVMGDFSGVQILERTLKRHRDAIVILMTGYPTVKTAISVLKKGGYDYLIKPFKLDDLKATIKRGLESQQIKRENVELKSQLELMKVTREYSEGMSLQPFLNLITNSAVTVLPAKGVSIMLKGRRSDRFKVKSIVDKTGDENINQFLTDCHKGTVEFETDHKPTVFYDKADGGNIRICRSFVSHPMLSSGKVIGLLRLVYEDKFSYISPGQMRMISLLASSATSAVERSYLDRDLKRSYYQTIKTLANAIEARDRYTAGHTDRVYRLAKIIARKMGWSVEQLLELRTGCLLHDIGKIGVPDAILNKPEALTDYERNIMMKHPEMGAKILRGIPFLKAIIPYVLYHHEKFDGSGYPDGLKGSEIPIEGRLLAVVDTFDAITSDRPYRQGRSTELAIDELEKFSGTQFDPEIVKLFKDLCDEGRIRFGFDTNYRSNLKMKVLSST